jgi:hypothetical protein
MNAAVLLHGGTMTRRAALSRAIRRARGLDVVRIRLSSSAAEAAKCLADPAVRAVFLLDAPRDADRVREAAVSRGLRAHVYALEARDTEEVLVALVRGALPVSPEVASGPGDATPTDRP